MEKLTSKGILILIGIAVVILVALFFILPRGGISGSVVNEGVIKDCGEGTTLYLEKGLCWEKSTMPGPAKNWDDANSYCEDLVLGNKEDWRLPTLQGTDPPMQHSEPLERTIGLRMV